MKTVLFTAALLLGTAAAAQQTQTPEPETQGTQSSPTTSSQTTDTTTRQGTTAEGTNPEGQAAPPPGANVLASPPPGAGVVLKPNQDALFAPRPATMEYPPCSATVTDSCVQGKSRRRR